MWHSNDMFRYVLKAEFVTLVSLKVPSGKTWKSDKWKAYLKWHNRFTVLAKQKIWEE